MLPTVEAVDRGDGMPYAAVDKWYNVVYSADVIASMAVVVII